MWQLVLVVGPHITSIRSYDNSDFKRLLAAVVLSLMARYHDPLDQLFVCVCVCMIRSAVFRLATSAALPATPRTVGDDALRCRW